MQAKTCLYLPLATASAIGIVYGTRSLRCGPGSGLPGGNTRFASAHSLGLRLGGGLSIAATFPQILDLAEFSCCVLEDCVIFSVQQLQDSLRIGHARKLAGQAGAHAAFLTREGSGPLDNDGLDVVNLEHLAGFLQIGQLGVLLLHVQQLDTGGFQVGVARAAALLSHCIAQISNVTSNRRFFVVTVARVLRQSSVAGQLVNPLDRTIKQFCQGFGCTKFGFDF